MECNLMTTKEHVKHTPRPWFVSGKQVRYCMPNFKTSELLADCWTEEDACLIAASPRMVDALQAIQNWSWTLPHSLREADVWKKVDSAIKEAIDASTLPQAAQNFGAYVAKPSPRPKRA